MIDYEVYDQRPSDSNLLVPAIETHQKMLGRTPHLVAADAAFYSAKNEAAAKAKGVKRVCVPNRSTKSAERQREQRKRGFATARNGGPDASDASAWPKDDTVSIAAGTGDNGMKRWVGLGVISDNLINIGRVKARQTAKAKQSAP